MGISAVIFLLTFLSAVVFDVIGTKIPAFGNHATVFYRMPTLPVLAVSVFGFLGFLKMDIGHKRIINLIAETTFGVYLIHDNKYVRAFLWKDVFHNASYADSNILIPYSLFAIALVFVCCVMIELFRIHAMEKHYMKALNTISDFLERGKEKLLSKGKDAGKNL